MKQTKEKTGKSLVIVESPTKARTLSRYLPKGFVVEASVGHIRDLPDSARAIPTAVKEKPWARLGIDIENDFEPLYVVPAEKKKTVTKLRGLLKEADTLYLATDEDREGESISWHLVKVLKPKVPRRRLVFHEITKSAIDKALETPRDLDERLVQAQETRRILDRLFGYEVSPILWRKIKPRLSAGRVQSVAVRIVVERERARRSFVRSTYWDLAADFQRAEPPSAPFAATLIRLGDRRIATGKDFDSATGKLRAAKDGEAAVVLVNEEKAQELEQSLRESTWKCTRSDRKPYTDRPSPPFTTSTLQQEANRKLRLSTRMSMQAAQRLYERGYITYMRTDSTTLAKEAIDRARSLIGELYGTEFLAKEARQFRTKVKNAQEAHEAIRPSGEFRRPEELKRDPELGDLEVRIYELIWKRTMACQMAEARGHRVTLHLSDGNAVFQATGKTIEFAGYLRAYVEGADDPDAELADKELILPDIQIGDPVECKDLKAKSHTTQPPARYTEASLVKELEARGIGRPSTYATIIDTILRREYVFKQGNALVPSFTAFAVVNLLEKHFTDLVDVAFTARMEDDLDAISLGDMDSLPYLRSFYFGGDKRGLKELLQSDIDARESCTLRLGADSEGRDINVRIGRYGPYLERAEQRAPLPEGMPPDELTLEKAEDLLAKGSGPEKLGLDPETGKPVYVRVGRFGPFVQLGENDDGEKPKMKSLLPGMSTETTRLEDALRLLSLPRKIGADPETGEDIFADYGRYGPYLKRGTENRSLDKAEDIFEIDVERASAVFKEKRKGRARGAPQALKEVGVDPLTESPIKLMSGRYGPYVTNGDVNASLPRGMAPDDVTQDVAEQLLRAREEKIASGGGRKAKKTAKKKTAKKAKKAKKTKTAKTAKAAKKTAETKKSSGKPAATRSGSGGAAKKSKKKKASKKKTATKAAK